MPIVPRPSGSLTHAGSLLGLVGYAPVADIAHKSQMKGISILEGLQRKLKDEIKT